MGGFTSKTQQDLKQYLQNQYDITNYPSIVHKNKKNKALVHQIVTDSAQQAHKIRTDVQLYNKLRCESISKVLEYIPLESDKICSEQEYHYIVEQDLQKYNLKHQFLARKYYKQRFSDHQIISILKTYLCGLDIYHLKFLRKFNDSICLQLITVDQQHSNQLRLIDPILKGQSTSIPFKQKQIMSNSKNKLQNQQKVLIKQAPQKNQARKTQFNQHIPQCNQFFADLYQVGIICLQLHRMEFFNRYEYSSILNSQIASISNRQIKKAVELLINPNPLQRGRVYEVIKNSSQQKYCLQKNLKRGKIIQQPVFSDPIKQNKLLIPNQVQKVETSFSFGNSQFQLSPTYKVSESFGTNTNDQRSIYQINNIDRNKATTISNLSTDRSLNQNITPMTSTWSNRQVPSYNKPTIKFVSGNSSANNLQTVKVLSSSSSNLYNNTINPNSNLYQNNSASLLSKQNQRLPIRSNSYVYNQNSEKPLFKQSDYSPFKKQQDISPLSQKDVPRISADNGNYKEIFSKYSYLNFQSNSGYSPGKTAENDKMQAEINRLLRGSLQKQSENSNKQLDSNLNNKQPMNNKQYINNNSLTSNKYSPIVGFNKIDSPISALETNMNQNMTPFVSKQNSFVRNTNIIQNNQFNSEIPVYRPNKQVQQILKRLGIGSLLYGNSQNNSDKQLESNQFNNQRKNSMNNSQNNKQDLFVHKVNYTINKGVNLSNSTNQDTQFKKQRNLQFQNAKNLLKSEQNDIHDRQTTPIRPVNKAKYNSTIVEVGDEDSQYSSSGVRNLQNYTEPDIDLTNHEFVNQQYETGSRYEGYKLDGERNGYGKFFYQDGGYYEGQWKNNKMDGFGRLYYEGGKLAYEGHWAKDQFHGFGKVYNDNPVTLQCGFDFTNFDLLEDYWEYYQGMLVKDTKQGRGKIKLTNDQVFEGDFHNDRIQGFGKFFLREGNMIQGIWRDSKLIKIIN